MVPKRWSRPRICERSAEGCTSLEPTKGRVLPQPTEDDRSGYDRDGPEALVPTSRVRAAHEGMHITSTHEGAHTATAHGG